MLLLVDNYDSFVFNLDRYFHELGQETLVVRNDQLSVAEVAALQPQAVILSPGPCSPNEAGICIELIRTLHERVPIFGVCLGHQALGAAFGASVPRAPEPVHGRVSPIAHVGSPLFANIPSPFQATRYHSLIVDEATLPPDLRVTARTPDGLVMALEHTRWPVCSVQFHPESILTQHGHQLLANFLSIAQIPCGPVPNGDALEVTTLGPQPIEDLESGLDSRWVSDEQQSPPLHW